MLRHSALTGREINKVAVCGGSGSELISAAIAEGADAFITADVKYHRFAEVDDKLLLIDAGHYETEQFTKDLFVELISKILLTLPSIRPKERRIRFLYLNS